jgi:hypothetical protein
MEDLAVDVGLLPLALVGTALVAFGALHLWKADRFFAFYTRFNEGKGLSSSPEVHQRGQHVSSESPHRDRDHGVHRCLHLIPQATGARRPRPHPRPPFARAVSRYFGRSLAMEGGTSVGTEASLSGGAASGPVSIRRRRLLWGPLLVVLGTVAAMGVWYVLTVDAITDTLEPSPPLDGVTLAGVDPDHGMGYTALSLKNDSLLPLTILRMEPILAHCCVSGQAA